MGGVTKRGNIAFEVSVPPKPFRRSGSPRQDSGGDFHAQGLWRVHATMKKSARQQGSAPYSEISEVYDFLLKHVDYERWYRYIREIIFMHMTDPGYILEIGCGTGKFGAKFSRDDFTIFGMDISPQMLNVARSRAFRNFHVFLGDVRRFCLARKFDFIFCVHDTLNYLLDVSDLKRAFSCVRDVMHEDSVFLFDLTTEYNILRFFDRQAKRYRYRGMEVHWSNDYNPASKLISSELSVKRRDGSVARETHVQRIYETEEILPVLDECGFEVYNVFSDYTHFPPGEKTVMKNFVVKLRQGGL